VLPILLPVKSLTIKTCCRVADFPEHTISFIGFPTIPSKRPGRLGEASQPLTLLPMVRRSESVKVDQTDLDSKAKRRDLDLDPNWKRGNFGRVDFWFGPFLPIHQGTLCQNTM